MNKRRFLTKCLVCSFQTPFELMIVNWMITGQIQPTVLSKFALCDFFFPPELQYAFHCSAYHMLVACRKEFQFSLLCSTGSGSVSGFQFIITVASNVTFERDDDDDDGSNNRLLMRLQASTIIGLKYKQCHWSIILILMSIH